MERKGKACNEHETDGAHPAFLEVQQFEQTPLWLGFGDDATNDRVPRKLERRWGEDPPESLVSEDVIPIRIQPGYTYFEVLDDVVGQLERLARHFQEIYATDALQEGSE